MSTCPLFTEVQDEIIKWIPTKYLFRCRLVSSHWNETCSRKIGHVTKVIVEFDKDRDRSSAALITGKRNVKAFLEIFTKSRQILNDKMLRIKQFQLNLGIASKREIQWDMAKLFQLIQSFDKLQRGGRNLSFVLRVNTDDSGWTTVVTHMSPNIVLEVVEFTSPVIPRNSKALFAHSTWLGSLHDLQIMLDPESLIDSGLSSVVMTNLVRLVVELSWEECSFRRNGSKDPEIPKKKMALLRGANLPQLANLEITTPASFLSVLIPADNFGMMGPGIENEVFPNLRTLELASDLPEFLKRIYWDRVFPKLVKLVAAHRQYYPCE